MLLRWNDEKHNTHTASGNTRPAEHVYCRSKVRCTSSCAKITPVFPRSIIFAHKTKAELKIHTKQELLSHPIFGKNSPSPDMENRYMGPKFSLFTRVVEDQRELIPQYSCQQRSVLLYVCSSSKRADRNQSQQISGEAVRLARIHRRRSVGCQQTLDALDNLSSSSSSSEATSIRALSCSNDGVNGSTNRIIWDKKSRSHLQKLEVRCQRTTHAPGIGKQNTYMNVYTQLCVVDGTRRATSTTNEGVVRDRGRVGYLWCRISHGRLAQTLLGASNSVGWSACFTKHIPNSRRARPRWTWSSRRSARHRYAE